MDGLNLKSIFLLIGFVIAVFFVLNLIATSLSVWFGWRPPKLLSGLFNAPQWLMVIGWIALGYVAFSALLDFPFVDLFPEQAESEFAP